MSMNDFIPEGFSPLAEWDFRERQKQDGHSPEWKALSDAAKARKVPAFRLSNGRWYVHKQKATEFLATCYLTPVNAPAKPAGKSLAEDSRIEAAVIALCEINNGITLMQATLERLTAAVENIATQPKTPHQELMASIGTNGNGFHQ